MGWQMVLLNHWPAMGLRLTSKIVRQSKVKSLGALIGVHFCLMGYLY